MFRQLDEVQSKRPRKHKVRRCRLFLTIADDSVLQRSSSKGGETGSASSDGDANSSSGNNSSSGSSSSSGSGSGSSGDRKKRRLRDKGKEAAKGVLSVVKTVLMILASLVGLALLIVVLIDTRAVASEEMLAEG